MNIYPVLSKGDRGSYVTILQKRLNDWGCNAGAPDGVFGDNTERAVKDFQSKRQTVQFARLPLVVDGVVGLETWAELVKVPADAIEIQKITEILAPSHAQHIFGRRPTSAQMDDLNRCLQMFEIATAQRKRHFLAQIAHESGGLQWTRELASGDAYEGRSDLGNRLPGDGRKFKGAGFIQLTGRYNYEAFAKHINDPKVVEIGCSYVAEVYPATSAGFWWMNNRMNAVCDRPDVSVLIVSRIVNGGPGFSGTPNGLSDRIYYYNRACQVIK